MYIPGIPCSGQPDNIPESPCQGLWPPSFTQTLLRRDPLPGVLFKCKPTNPEPTAQPLPLWSSHTPPGHFPLSKSPRAQEQTARPRNRPRNMPMSQSLLKCFKPAVPTPAYAASLISSCGIHNKGSCQRSPFSVCLLPSLGF